MRKWQRGVGTSPATRPTRSLFIYPGYRSVVVDAAITVDTSEFSCDTDGDAMRRRSAAIALSAVLSSTTTASALTVRRFMVRMLLYGCTTTSDCDSLWLGNTL